jgi:hypothetical protein
LDPASAGVAAAVGLLLACGGSDRQAPDPGEFEIAKPAANSGDAQVGVAGVRLPDSLRVVVTRNQEPAEGVTVIWSTPEGSVNPAVVRTGSDGMAATTWTPLPLFAEQLVSTELLAGAWGTRTSHHSLGCRMPRDQKPLSTWFLASPLSCTPMVWWRPRTDQLMAYSGS